MGFSTERVTEVGVPGGSYGSGYLVSPHLVLTARHVVEGALPPQPIPAPPGPFTRESLRTLSRGQPRCRVRALSRAKHQPFHDAVVLWWLPGGAAEQVEEGEVERDNRGVDVALIGVIDDDWEPPEAGDGLAWSDLDGHLPVACLALGFPAADSYGVDESERPTRELTGTIAPLSLYREQKWAVHGSESIGRAPWRGQSSWAGMSGAALFDAARDVLVGVIAVDADPADSSRLELWAEPARLFAEDPDFTSWVAADGGARAWLHAATLKSEAIFHNVPLRPDHPLVARTQLFDDVKRKLRQADSGRHALTVLPGVGKTDLAVRLAYDEDLRRHFSDGVLWAGLGTAPAVPTLLGGWASALGISRATLRREQGVNGRRELVRAALRDRKLLLIVDDVYDSDTARDFLVGGEGCAHLVTTRVRQVARRLVAKDATEKLAELDAAEQLDLFVSLAPTARVCLSPEEVRMLLRAAGGLPLAIVLLAARLENECDEDDPERCRDAFTDLQCGLERLHTGDVVSRNDWTPSIPVGTPRSLLAVIGVSSQPLETRWEPAALWGVSVFRPRPGSFSKEAARAVTSQSSRVIYDLEDAGLIEAVDAGCYAMPQAIADYGRKRLADSSPGRELELHHRAVDYYAQRIRSSEDHFRDLSAYKRQERYENPDWAALKVEWLYHLAALNDPLAVELAISKFYLEAHWWWNCYIEYPLAEEILAVPVTGNAVHLLETLRQFDASYPKWHLHRGRGDWDAVERILRDLRRQLGVDRDIDALDEDGRHVRALSNIFLAHCLGHRDASSPEPDRLYDESYSLLEVSPNDVWSLGWILYEQGDLAYRRGDLDRTLERSAKSMPLALEQEDFELVANNYRLRAEVAFERGDLELGIRAQALVLFYSLKFQELPEAPDFYERAFHEEVTSECLGRLLHVAQSSGSKDAAGLAVRLHDFWSPEMWPAWHSDMNHGSDLHRVSLAISAGDTAELRRSLIPDLSGMEPEELADRLEEVGRRIADEAPGG